MKKIKPDLDGQHGDDPQDDIEWVRDGLRSLMPTERLVAEGRRMAALIVKHASNEVLSAILREPGAEQVYVVESYAAKAVYQLSDEGGYTVSVPGLPGCVSEGDTREEAERNIREAIALHME